MMGVYTHPANSSHLRSPLISPSIFHYCFKLSDSAVDYCNSPHFLFSMLYWTLISFLLSFEISLNLLLGAKASSSNFIPGRVPLGIRSPYFNSWMEYGNPVPAWPFFWRDNVSLSVFLCICSGELVLTRMIDYYRRYRADQNRWRDMGMAGICRRYGKAEQCCCGWSRNYPDKDDIYISRWTYGSNCHLHFTDWGEWAWILDMLRLYWSCRSPTIPWSNHSPLSIYRWKRNQRMVSLIMCRCTLISPQVCGLLLPIRG